MPEDLDQFDWVSNIHFQKWHPRVLRALITMVLSSFVLLIAIIYLIMNKPEASFYTVGSNGNVVQQLQPLNMPIISTPGLLQWATRAAVAVYTYNWVNYTDELQKARPYFSTGGWQSFTQSLDKSGFIATVTSRNLSVTAVADGSPVVTKRGIVSGHFFWQIQVPLLITFESASETTKQSMIITMLIARAATDQYPQGIAIQQFYSVHRAVEAS